MTCECLTAIDCIHQVALWLRYGCAMVALFNFHLLFKPGTLQGFASDVAHLVSRRTGVFFLKTLQVFYEHVTCPLHV